FDGTTGATFGTTPDGRTVVTLHLVDGGRGDDDLTVNDTIVDPGAPGSPLPSVPPPPVRPRPLVIGGDPTGTASVFAPDGAGRFGRPPAAALSPFGPVPANLRPAVADVDGDGVADTILVTGPGTPARLAVVGGKDGSLLVPPFDPFGGDFTGGGFVAA